MCTFERRPFLHKKRVPEMLIKSLTFCRRKIKELIAYTVMPDHLHLLVEIEDAEDLRSFLRDFKRHTSKEIKSITGTKIKHIWQRGTMDHCIRESNSNSDFENHLYYLFFNSVKHLGIRPKDFPHHNFREMVDRGLIDEDFYDLSEQQLKEFEIYE